VFFRLSSGRSRRVSTALALSVLGCVSLQAVSAQPAPHDASIIGNRNADELDCQFESGSASTELALECAGFSAANYAENPEVSAQIDTLIQECAGFPYASYIQPEALDYHIPIDGVVMFYTGREVDDVFILSVPYGGKIEELFQFLDIPLFSSDFSLPDSLAGAFSTVTLNYNFLHQDFGSNNAEYAFQACRVWEQESLSGKRIHLDISADVDRSNYDQHAESLAHCVASAFFSALGLSPYLHQAENSVELTQWDDVTGDASVIYRYSRIGFPLTNELRCLAGFYPVVRSGRVTINEYLASADKLLSVFE